MHSPWLSTSHYPRGAGGIWRGTTGRCYSKLFLVLSFLCNNSEKVEVICCYLLLQCITKYFKPEWCGGSGWIATEDVWSDWGEAGRAAGDPSSAPTTTTAVNRLRRPYQKHAVPFFFFRMRKSLLICIVSLFYFTTPFFLLWLLNFVMPFFNRRADASSC